MIIGGSTPSDYDPARPATAPHLPPDGLIPDDEWAYYQEHKNDPGGYVPPVKESTTDTGHYDDGHGLSPDRTPPPPGHDIDDGSYLPPAPPPGVTVSPQEIETSALPLPDDPGKSAPDPTTTAPPAPDPLPPGVNRPQPHVKWDESGAEMSDSYERDAALFMGSAVLPESDLPPIEGSRLEPPPLGWDQHHPSNPGDHAVAASGGGGDDRSGLKRVVVGGVLAVLIVVAVVVVAALSGSDDGSGDAVTDDAPTTEGVSETTRDLSPSDGGVVPVDGPAAKARPISYTSTCNGAQCNVYDAVSCTFTYHLLVTFAFPDGASHEGEIATVATVGPGWEPTYELPVVNGGIDTTLTASHCLASGESASWRAVVTAVGDAPTITPDPPR